MIRSMFFALVGTTLFLSASWAGRQVVLLVDSHDVCRAYATQSVLPELGTLSVGDGIKIWESSSARSIFSKPSFPRNPFLDLEPIFMKSWGMEAPPVTDLIPSGIPNAEGIFVSQLAEKYYKAAKTRKLPPIDLIFVSSPFLNYSEGLKQGRYATVGGQVPNAAAFQSRGFPLRIRSSLAEGIASEDWGLRLSWVFPKALIQQEAQNVLTALQGESGSQVSSLALQDIQRWLKAELGRMWATYLGQFGIRLVHFDSAPVMPWQEISPIDGWTAEELEEKGAGVIRYGDEVASSEPEPIELEALFLTAPWKLGSSDTVETIIAAGAIESRVGDYLEATPEVRPLLAKAKGVICLGVASKDGSRQSNEALARRRAESIGQSLRTKFGFRKPVYGQSLGQYRGDQEDQQYQRGLVIIALTSGDEKILANPLLLQKAVADWEDYPVDRSEYSQADLFPVK
ncbi:MAG: hypothetical protein AAF191_08240 [Verrucomicrobiota bacterium]